jgi:recombination protein RecT
MANQMQPGQRKPSIKTYLESDLVKKKIADILGKRSGGFITSMLSLAGNDALLAEAEPASLFNAALTAASLDLPINKNLGFAHIIGYKNNRKGIVEAQFQIGAKGLRQLAIRSGQYKYINESDVREGELKSFNRLTGEVEFDWNDDLDIRGQLPVIGYVSYYQLHSGFSNTTYMSVEEIKQHATRYSQSFKSGYGPWADNFPAMASKTVAKRNLAGGPMSVELQIALAADQGVLHDDGDVDYPDNEPTIDDVGADDDAQAAILAEHGVGEGDHAAPDTSTAEPALPLGDKPRRGRPAIGN